jgi:hypothetical protein
VTYDCKKLCQLYWGKMGVYFSQWKRKRNKLEDRRVTETDEKFQ